jgi:hypothetical protein
MAVRLTVVVDRRCRRPERLQRARIERGETRGAARREPKKLSPSSAS